LWSTGKSNQPALIGQRPVTMLSTANQHHVARFKNSADGLIATPKLNDTDTVDDRMSLMLIVDMPSADTGIRLRFVWGR
jgi:hypothetical protein